MFKRCFLKISCSKKSKYSIINRISFPLKSFMISFLSSFQLSKYENKLIKCLFLILIFSYQIWLKFYSKVTLVIYLWSPLSPKYMLDIFINSFRTCIYSHGTYSNPFLNFGWKMYGFSKAKEGNHRHWILSSNGKRKRLGFCSIQRCDITKWIDP